MLQTLSFNRKRFHLCKPSFRTISAIFKRCPDKPAGSSAAVSPVIVSRHLLGNILASLTEHGNPDRNDRYARIRHCPRQQRRKYFNGVMLVFHSDDGGVGGYPDKRLMQIQSGNTSRQSGKWITMS